MSGRICVREWDEHARGVPCGNVQLGDWADEYGAVCRLLGWTLLQRHWIDCAERGVRCRILLPTREHESDTRDDNEHRRPVPGRLVLSGGQCVAGGMRGGDIPEPERTEQLRDVSAWVLLLGECDRVREHDRVPARALLPGRDGVRHRVCMPAGDVQQCDAGQQQRGLPRVPARILLREPGTGVAERRVPGRVLLRGGCDDGGADGRRERRRVSGGNVLSGGQRERHAVSGRGVLREQRAGVAERGVRCRTLLQRGSDDGDARSGGGRRRAVSGRAVLRARQQCGDTVPDGAILELGWAAG